MWNIGVLRIQIWRIVICDVIELIGDRTLERQKQLLMSSISNLGGRESLEIAVKELYSDLKYHILDPTRSSRSSVGAEHFAGIPNVVGFIPTVVRHIFQLHGVDVN